MQSVKEIWLKSRAPSAKHVSPTPIIAGQLSSLPHEIPVLCTFHNPLDILVTRANKRGFSVSCNSDNAPFQKMASDSRVGKHGTQNEDGDVFVGLHP